ncbi:CoA-transferase family III domain containing protein [Rhypophila sp. PSN 637]
MSTPAVKPTPLSNLKVLEFAGLAPGPFAGLLLSDAGASVLRIDRPVRPNSPVLPATDLLTRHKSSLPLDLKSPSVRPLLLSLIRRADVLIDPFRPGVLEKLGLGPDYILNEVNPGLIYARMTGFRRDGRYRDMAGHDINYLAVSGVLSMLGPSKKRGGKPSPPINILGDFAGGGAVLFQGILMALLARQQNGDGKGQVVEANMVDGANYLATFPRFARKTLTGSLPRGENLLDGGCPYYDVYETKDEGGYMAVGALEPQFFGELMKGLGLDGEGWERKRYDKDTWDELRGILERKFREKTRKEWEDVFDGTDACCTPVLGYDELENGDWEGREGDQRPVVTLRESPLLAVKRGAKKEDAVRLGQGDGVEGEGYVGQPLEIGKGGKEVLESWLGWIEGREFRVEGGEVALLKKEPAAKAKL